MEQVQINRFDEDMVAVSPLDHLDDALDLVAFLTAEDFVAAQLHERHGKPKAASRRLARRISAHANLAREYAKLSISAPAEISFLPGYYAILNLAKIYSLCGPFSNEFDHHAKWHGATYNPQKKASQTLLTEEVRIRSGGTLALFYKTLTHIPVTNDRVLKIKDVCHLVPGIGSEVSIVTGKYHFPLLLKFRAVITGGVVSVEADVHLVQDGGTTTPYTGNVQKIPCLRGFRKKHGSINTFESSGNAPPGATAAKAARSLITPVFLLAKGNKDAHELCFEQGRALPIPEEFASAISFFHMSSVCRYNPEFLHKLSRSTAWPMLLQARRHSLLHFLVSTWSFVIKKNYILLG